MARIEVDLAAESEIVSDQIERDNAQITSGDERADAAKWPDAVEHYRVAWSHSIYLEIDSLTIGSDGSACAGFVGIAGRTYVLETSINLVDWTSVRTNVCQTPGMMTIKEPNLSVHQTRFYRLKCKPSDEQ